MENSAPVTVFSPSRFYASVKIKFGVAFVAALAWTTLSAVLAWPWIVQLAHVLTFEIAIPIVSLIALVPGYMNAFIASSLLMDRRPSRRKVQAYPAVSVLVAAYNEVACIAATIESVMQCGYPGELELLIIDDGSTDGTRQLLGALQFPNVRVITAQHGGKALALNQGLSQAAHDLIITIDADTFLYKDALTRIVERLLSDPEDTVAVAGAILVRNSRKNLISRMQEWDYFHGIASVKRAQSFLQGTLVAQGAFSIYRKAAVLECGGWPDKVGEDIVLTWDLLERGARVGYAEDAVAFTNVPATYGAFFQQRKRWSRGLIEAFRCHWRLLLRARMKTLFIYWNFLFPVLDAAYLLIFMPGVVLALMGHYYIAGPMTIAVLPLAFLINLLMFRVQGPMFNAQGLSVRKNIIGLIGYTLLYTLFLQPATIAGYFSELLGLRRGWGTK